MVVLIGASSCVRRTDRVPLIGVAGDLPGFFVSFSTGHIPSLEGRLAEALYLRASVVDVVASGPVDGRWRGGKGSARSSATEGESAFFSRESGGSSTCEKTSCQTIPDTLRIKFGRIGVLESGRSVRQRRAVNRK